SPATSIARVHTGDFSGLTQPHEIRADVRAPQGQASGNLTGRTWWKGSRRRPATAMQSASPNFWDAGRVSADGAYPISVNPGWEGQKRARKGRSWSPIRSEPAQLINPILSGWVNYFALGDSGECFTFIQDWVEKKVRRHMMRARNRKGFGWTRWSRQW